MKQHLMFVHAISGCDTVSAPYMKLSKFGGPYLPHHWSDWPKILDLVLWVPKQHVYQVSLKSETVGFKFSVILGDLTRNDPYVAKISDKNDFQF